MAMLDPKLEVHTAHDVPELQTAKKKAGGESPQAGWAEWMRGRLDVFPGK
jgi:hypothetical protein